MRRVMNSAARESNGRTALPMKPGSPPRAVVSAHPGGHGGQPVFRLGCPAPLQRERERMSAADTRQVEFNLTCFGNYSRRHSAAALGTTRPHSRRAAAAPYRFPVPVWNRVLLMSHPQGSVAPISEVLPRRHPKASSVAPLGLHTYVATCSGARTIPRGANPCLPIYNSQHCRHSSTCHDQRSVISRGASCRPATPPETSYA